MLNRVFKKVVANYLVITYITAFAGIILSLYYSEVLELPPCTLCWYQRIFFYPIAPIALISYLKKDKYAYRYILALAIPGLILATYHYLLQKTAVFPEIFCSLGSSCSSIQIEYLGFITIPLMSFLGFLLIVVLNILGKKRF